MIKRLLAMLESKIQAAPLGSEKYGYPAEYITLDNNNYIACIKRKPWTLQILGMEYENEDVPAELWRITQKVIRQNKIRVVECMSQSKPEFADHLLAFGFVEVPHIEDTCHCIYRYRPEVAE